MLAIRRQYQVGQERQRAEDHDHAGQHEARMLPHRERREDEQHHGEAEEPAARSRGDNRAHHEEGAAGGGDPLDE